MEAVYGGITHLFFHLLLTTLVCACCSRYGCLNVQHFTSALYCVRHQLLIWQCPLCSLACTALFTPLCCCFADVRVAGLLSQESMFVSGLLATFVGCCAPLSIGGWLALFCAYRVLLDLRESDAYAVVAGICTGLRHVYMQADYIRSGWY